MLFGYLRLPSLRESVEDMCNDVASEAIAARDRIGDRFLATAEGYGWLPTRGEGRKQRERRALWRDVATQNELPEKEEEVRRLKNADGIANEALETAKRELHEAEVSYSKADGIHVQAYKAALAHFGISKTAYFGHAYIGKYCKLLCAQRIAVAISEPCLRRWSEQRRRVVALRGRISFLKNQIRKAKRQGRWDDVADLEFRLQDKRFAYALVGSNLKRDVEYQAALRVRQRWVHRFTKWAALQRLMGGSIDYTANPHLIEMLIVRAASFSGFFACNFPNEKPTPKLYLALTHGIQFIMHHKFCGYADEEPMESQHADHNRIRVRSRHCVNQQVAMLHGVNTLLVRNNVNCCITAGKLRDERNELG